MNRKRKNNTSSSGSSTIPSKRPMINRAVIQNENQLPETNPSKHYKQKYLTEWEAGRKWLRRSKVDEYHFYCTYCDKNYVCGITEVNRHGENDKHKINSDKRNQPKISSSLIVQPSSKKVKEAEIRLAAYIVQHNIPFSASDDLPKLIKSICPESEIAKEICCGRTKCTEIIKNVLGRDSHEQLLELMRKEKFSLIIDESADYSNTKHLAIVIRIKIDRKIKDCLLALISVSEATAEILYNHIVKYFTDNDIPYKTNLIGFAADGANVMMGGKQSVSILLKKDIPNLFIFKCICHSFALCASYACEKLPNSPENLARSIYKYFRYSSKKSEQYKEFQSFCEVKPHRILHPSQTRWLSLTAVVKRLLSQWNPLYLFFTAEVSEDKSNESAPNILRTMNNVFVKLYLEFLEFILPYIVDLNVEMQSEVPKIYLLYSRVEKVVKTILEFFIKPSILKDKNIQDIKHRDPHSLLSIKDVYLGTKVKNYLKNNGDLPKEQVDKFILSCLSFYQELIDQILLRFSLKQKNLQFMNVIDPKNVIKKKSGSILHLASHFPNVISEDEYNDLDKQWRMLLNDNSIDDISTDDFYEFWSNINTEIDITLVMKIVDHISILPHSSACAERVFSIINFNKTRLRNKMKTDTLEGILRTKRILGDNSSYNFEITSNMLKLVNVTMYSFKNNKSSDKTKE